MKIILLRSLLLLLIFGCARKKTSEPSRIEQEGETTIQMQRLVDILIADSHLHTDIGPKLTEIEIKESEERLGLRLPASYRFFLKNFGNSAYWIYHQNVNELETLSFLNEYPKNPRKTIELEEEGRQIEVASLLCLMTEDSNGGAWCWITSENNDSGEWPLVYYSLSDRKLHYKLENFVKWLEILTECKHEVIRELDKAEKLHLG